MSGSPKSAACGEANGGPSSAIDRSDCLKIREANSDIELMPPGRESNRVERFGRLAS